MLDNEQSQKKKKEEEKEKKKQRGSSEASPRRAQPALNSLTKAKGVRARGHTHCVSCLALQQRLRQRQQVLRRHSQQHEGVGEREREQGLGVVGRESESTSTSYANEFVVIAAPLLLLPLLTSLLAERVVFTAAHSSQRRGGRGPSHGVERRA